MRGKKAETAIELLITYSWVVLLILALFIVAYYSGYLNFTNMLPQYCSITPTLGCSTYKFGFMPDGQSMVLVYRVVNGLALPELCPAPRQVCPYCFFSEYAAKP